MAHSLKPFSLSCRSSQYGNSGRALRKTTGQHPRAVLDTHNASWEKKRDDSDIVLLKQQGVRQLVPRQGLAGPHTRCNGAFNDLGFHQYAWMLDLIIAGVGWGEVISTL
jgi:hypothetical protein